MTKPVRIYTFSLPLHSFLPCSGQGKGKDNMSYDRWIKEVYPHLYHGGQPQHSFHR